MPTSAHIQFYVDGDGATGDDLDRDGDGAAYDNIDDNCDGATGDKVNNDGNSVKLLLPLMRRHLHHRCDGVAALIAMASLPSPMRRHLAVVHNDGDGATGNSIDDDGKGAMYDNINNNDDYDGATGDEFDDDGDGMTGNKVDNDGNSGTC